MRKIENPDVSNTNPEYWETVLESHNLGMRQLKMDEDNDDVIPLSEMEDGE